MIASIASLICKESLFNPGDRVLLGISGGADSTALAYALHFLRSKFDLHLHLAHLHHGIRGADADEDLRFVRNLASKLNLPLLVGRCDVPRSAAEMNVSVEMAARGARLDFFRRQVCEHAIDRVALAHNFDDQAETVLLRIARGTGCAGLGGIAPVQDLGGLLVVHPMLAVRHRQAVDFLKAHGLKWREDATNSDYTYLRNRVRHRLLPLMEEMLNPNVSAALCRLADIVGAEDEFMTSAAEEVLKSCVNDNAWNLDLCELSRHPKAIRRRVILQWLVAAGVDPHVIDMEQIDAVDRICRDMAGSKKLDVGGGWRVLRRYSTLSIERDADGIDYSDPVPIDIPSETLLPFAPVLVETEYARGIVVEQGGCPGRTPTAASLSARKLVGRALLARRWRAGDRMRPYGMDGTRKLQDILTDCKVPEDRRGRVIVFEVSGEIVWLPGYRVSADWAVEDRGSPSIRISLHSVDRLTD